MEPATRKKLLLISLKLVVSGVLLFFVFRKAGLENIVLHLQAVNPWFFAAAVLMYIIATFLSALRWGLLLDETFPARKLFSFYIIGCFFNNLLPGIIGGDAVKIYYLYKDTGKGTSSFGSVFMDRFVGFSALLSIGLLSGMVAFNELETLRIQWVMPSLFAAFVCGSFILFGVRMGSRFRVVSNFYGYFHRYIRKKEVLLKTFLLSLLIQTLGITAVFLSGEAIGSRLPFTALFVFFPIIVILSMIPISISGFGVREGAFVLLFGLIGIPAQVSTSVSFLWFLSTAVASLIGLFEYMAYRKRDRAG